MTGSHSVQKESSGRKSHVRAVAAASLGNALEWFDIVVYGYFATIIAAQFFPTSDPLTSLLVAFGSFGVSFFVRPLGAVVIGAYADRKGRKKALLLTIKLMMLGTFIIAVMPSYGAIGIMAPVLIILARLIQGFSAGGEFASATAFLAEQSREHRAFFSSFQFASQGLTSLLAAVFGTALTALLTQDQLESWGWRIPFFFGLLIGPIAIYIRRFVNETPEFENASELEGTLSASLISQRGNLAIAVGLVILATVSMYMLLYMQTFAVRELSLSAETGFRATLAVGVALIFITPLAGAISDRKGRVKVAVPAAIMLLLLPTPLFLWIVASPSATRLLVIEALLAIITALYLGAIPALLTELFPVRVRTTGMSISYNLSVMIFGGLAPLFITAIIGLTGMRIAPGIYISFAALLSLGALFAAYRKGVR